MITVRQAVKRDYYTFHSMNQQFACDYDGAMASPDNAKAAFLNNTDTIRMICLEGKPIGYYTLQVIQNNKTGIRTSFIRDMFVLSEHRGLGIARFARQHAIRHDKIVGIQISFGRVRKNLDYFAKQGFSVLALDPREQGAEDHNLCVLLCKPNEIYTSILPLQMDYLNEAQQIAKEFWALEEAA